MKQIIEKLIIWTIVVALASSMGLVGCQDEKPPDPELQIIYDECKKLFTRIKVRDFEGIWECEYPYMWEERSLESYLGDYRLQRYKPDTLLAVEIDSVRMWGVDSAKCHMKLEWLLSDSTLATEAIELAWFKVDGQWYKPTVSMQFKQIEYEEEMKIYWEAVRAMEEEDENDETNPETTDGD